ncbi:DUF6843 domain-containing protein [Flavobacterium sp.]|jgi:hypothetical protein|uniref:DUF6843 domain-containing protein n=1 Tax=Flavobacterium sp. TaxID=239 RepID=UPI00391CA2F6
MKNYILLISICSLLFSCGIKKEVYILPNGYQGKVCVFYNQPFNKGETTRNGSVMTYYVPKDGIIFLNKEPRDITDLEFYYVDNNRTIDLTFSYDELSDKTVIYGGRKGWLTLPDNKEILYYSFYVGNKKTIDSINEINSEEFLKAKYYSVKKN